MLQTVKYLIYDFTFTFPFFFFFASFSIKGPDSTGPFFIYLEYLDAYKMMDRVEISIWNIWMWRK